jgi:hypothetical protein
MAEPPRPRLPDRLGAAPYVVAGLSFIPLVGVIFGLAAIVWSLVTRKAGRLKLGLIGGGGILFTIALYGGLFFFGFVERGGIYDHLRARLAQGQLYSVVQAVEFYKLQYGQYPDTLRQLQATIPQGSFVFIYDPSYFSFSGSRLFYYRRIDEDHYVLRGVGPDGVPFTDDDIVPMIPTVPNSRIGLLRDPPKP